MGDRAPWIKLWCDYTSTPSHDELDATALWVGVVLMLLVRAGNGSTDEPTTWALQPSGKPYTVAGIATRARVSARATEAALAALVTAGTVARREDGAWGLPRFWSFQRSSSTERMRRLRKSDADCDGPRDASGDDVTPKTVTLECQIASLPRSLRSPDSPPVSPPPGDHAANEPLWLESPAEAKSCEPTATDLLVAHVLGELKAACKTLDPQANGPRDTKGNRQLIARIQASESPTHEQWSTVIRRQLDSVRGRPETHKYLSLSTLCVPRNFSRLLDAPGGRGTGGAPRSKAWAPSDFNDDQEAP